MKTESIITGWLVPVLGIALVAASAVAVKYYSDLEQKADAGVADADRFERLCRDQELSLALKAIHEGDAQGASRRLDLLLCGDILRTDSELATADTEARAYMAGAFRRIAVTRPQIAADEISVPGHENSAGQIAAQQILANALGTLHTAQAH